MTAVDGSPRSGCGGSCGLGGEERWRRCVSTAVVDSYFGLRGLIETKSSCPTSLGGCLPPSIVRHYGLPPSTSL